MDELPVNGYDTRSAIEAIVDDVVANREPYVVHEHGQPVAVIVAWDDHHAMKRAVEQAWRGDR